MDIFSHGAWDVRSSFFGAEAAIPLVFWDRLIDGLDWIGLELIGNNYMGREGKRVATVCLIINFYILLFVALLYAGECSNISLSI